MLTIDSMFHQLLYIHLYRPFLRYTRNTSPLPSHVSPRKFCTQAAGAISKLFRLYKRTHGLRQICNIAIYIAHTACTIHILNLPDKNAKRDIVHGVKHLEEMGECWTQARRTLRILNLCAEKWKVELPEEAEAAFARGRLRWGILLGAPSPPGTLNNLVKQLNASPISELMARNLRRQQEQLQQLQQQKYNTHVPFNLGSSMAQLQPGLSAGMAPSPTATADTRRSSGNMSLPPQNAADFNREANRIRPSTQLTKEQQATWNAHQARLSSMNGQNNGVSVKKEQNTNAAQLFGGVDSLMEESQDWWFKDQSQLASGFENWNAPTQDWFGFENGIGYANPETMQSVPASNENFGYTNNNRNSGYGQFAGNGSTKNMMDMNGMNLNNGNGYRQQRTSFDDEILY